MDSPRSRPSASDFELEPLPGSVGHKDQLGGLVFADGARLPPACTVVEQPALAGDADTPIKPYVPEFDEDDADDGANSFFAANPRHASRRIPDRLWCSQIPPQHW
jgi:hypothetical protein